MDIDGQSATAEFQTLDELGIQSIDTNYADSTFIDAQGNEHRQIGSFTRTGGTIGTATYVWFRKTNVNIPPYPLFTLFTLSLPTN